MSSDLMKTVSLLRRAKDLARRWVRAWGTGEYGYYDAFLISVDIEPPHYIRFVPMIRDSSFNWKCWMDGKYLDDDTNLERDAKAWYDGEMNRRKAVSEREAYLRSTPEVSEYLSLTQRQYSIGVPDEDGYYTHPLHKDIRIK